MITTRRLALAGAVLLGGLALLVLTSCALTPPSTPVPPTPTMPPWDPAEPLTAELLGTEWELVTFWSAGPSPTAEPVATIPPNATRAYLYGKRATLIFMPYGGVAGQSPCNQFGGDPGSYRVGPGRTLRFGLLTQTAVGCEQSVMRDEDRFFAQMRATRAYRLEADGHLTLLDEAGQPLMTFAPAAATRPATPSGARRP